jgi:hypothetical protein
MQVCEEKASDVGERNLELIQALRGATSAIEKQLLFPGFQQNAWAEAGHHRPRIARAQKRYLEVLGVRGGGESNHNRQ